jgi:hypothetical protein
MIREKFSGLALCIRGGRLEWVVCDLSDLNFPAPELTWLVVDGGEYHKGFFHESTGLYLGYNNDMLMAVRHFDINARFLPIASKHGKYGGFVLHTLAEDDTMKQVSVVDNMTLVRNNGSHSPFEFVSVRRLS